MNWDLLADKIYVKTLASAARNVGRIPYIAENGVFDDQSERNISWWTNGFWAGQLWQLYSRRPDDLLRECAQEAEYKLDRALTDYMGMDHDSGFKWLLTSGASLALTGSIDSKNRLLLAAANLAGRLNPNGNFIRAWNDEDGKKAGIAIIDCMMNLPLLYKATELTGDPRFRSVAMLHAGTAARCFIRPDGSVRHIAVFDPSTGRYTGELGGQGMGQGSRWTRGCAWAVYGFALSYFHTGKGEYLAAAKTAAESFKNGMEGRRYRVPADFSQPKDVDYEDDSAAAIAACGLLELAELTGEVKYRDFAEGLVAFLAEERCDLDPERDGMITRCSVSYNDKRHNHHLIYADYFFTEAVLRLAGGGIRLW